MSTASCPTVCTDIESLVDLINQRGATLITIDGVPSAGKTPLAKSLASRLGWSILELDNYLRGRNGDEPFSNLVDPAFHDQLKAAGRPLIVEGVMIRDFVPMADAAVLSVYLMRISGMGLWHYDADIQRGNVIDIPGCTPSQLEREVLEYHRRQQPHINADVIFERLETLDG